MNTIIPWLEHLNVLMPSGHIALVGAGNGKGVWAQWLVHQASNSRVTLIEAEPLQYAMLQRTLNSLGERVRHCEIRNALVGAQPGTASFFVASSQQESGLLDPQSLLSLWPNLQTEEIRELSAITLDTVYGDLSEDAELPMGERHWLLIDCLPAGELLRASSKLDLVDVVIARVLLGEMHAMPDDTSLEEVAEFLQQKGMVQIAVEATRHPGIGYALFVRDARSALHAQVQAHHSESQKLRLNGEEQAKLLQEFQAQVGQLTQTKAAAEKRSQELAQQLEQLGQALEKQNRLAQERLSQMEQLAQTKLIVETQSQERVQQLEQLGKARDEQAKLAQERLAQTEQLTQAKAVAEKQSQERGQQLEQLTKARDEQAKLAQERHAQIEQLTQAKAAAEKQSHERTQQLEQLSKARDEQAELAQECHAQIEQLKQAKAAVEKQSQELVQQLEQLSKARDEQAKLAQERQAQTEQLTQAQAAAEKQLQERAQQLEQLTNAREEQMLLARGRLEQIEQSALAKAAVEQQLKERMVLLEQLMKVHNEQIELAQERRAQIKDLTQSKVVAEKLAQERAQQLTIFREMHAEQLKNNSSFPLIGNQPPINKVKKNIFILIRYSVLLETAKDYWRIGRTEFSSYREVLFSEERLKTREHLFSKICLPSLQNINKENINSEESVNFKAIILSSSDLPEDSKIFLEKVKKDNDFIELAYTSEKSGGVSKGFEEHLSLISPDEYCATVRLDDDDALSLDWFHKIKEYIKPEFEDYVISLCGGYALMVDENLKIQSVANFKMRFGALGLSYIAKGGSKYNIYNCGAHYKTDEKNPTILYSDGKYILRTYSKTNDSGDKFPEIGIIKKDDYKNVLIDSYGINF